MYAQHGPRQTPLSWALPLRSRLDSRSLRSNSVQFKKSQSMEREPPQTHLRPRRTRSNVCTECRRQKQKCDRQTPCGNCVRRDVIHLCQIPSPPQLQNHGRTATTTAASTAPQQTLSRDSRRRLDLSPVYRQPRSRASSADSPHVGRLWNSRGAKSYHAAPTSATNLPLPSWTWRALNCRSE